ncbi:alpha/beta hydrolase [Alteromonas gilva]|uniref:Alpha/beta hydrolase n=1 Tax=Alteromonas gilva TaxID=2987522 RepID=A0ABT5L1G1_9ALTE|nr:alpha/beta hydrolase [Alteromonas gilva]MDC8830883.1 alpha/beta hydrolase [Alteromonas gilva]
MQYLASQRHDLRGAMRTLRAQGQQVARALRSKIAGLKPVLMATGVVLAFPVVAQLDHTMTPIAVPTQPNAIELGTGELPGAEIAESWHAQYGSRFARNVTVATLTPFLPDPDKATGAAVVVAPGGGFRTLSMDNEGWDVASALAEQGVAAFVLKYRLNQTPATMADFQRSMEDMFSATGRRPPRPQPSEMKKQLAPQLEDSQAAFALIHDKADEWGIDRDRIGMIGFSAGAMLTMATSLVGEGHKPAFIGNVYGPITAVDVPADAPPLFVALAADDPFFANSDFGLIKNWHAAGKPVEFHFYEQGGHGFGMYQKDTTSTGWFDAYTSWLAMHGMLTQSDD